MSAECYVGPPARGVRCARVELGNTYCSFHGPRPVCPRLKNTSSLYLSSWPPMAGLSITPLCTENSHKGKPGILTIGKWFSSTCIQNIQYSCSVTLQIYNIEIQFCITWIACDMIKRFKISRNYFHFLCFINFKTTYVYLIYINFAYNIHTKSEIHIQVQQILVSLKNKPPVWLDLVWKPVGGPFIWTMYLTRPRCTTVIGRTGWWPCSETQWIKNSATCTFTM